MLVYEDLSPMMRYHTMKDRPVAFLCIPALLTFIRGVGPDASWNTEAGHILGTSPFPTTS